MKPKFDDADDDYTIESGIIKNPGKFESEPHWVPVLWDRVQAGFSDVSVHDGSMAIDGFKLDANLAPLVAMDPDPDKYVCLWSDDNGFVSHMVMTEDMLFNCETGDDWETPWYDYDGPDGGYVGSH